MIISKPLEISEVMTNTITLEWHQYTDDTTLMHKFSNPTDACTTINNQLFNLSKLADQIG